MEKVMQEEISNEEEFIEIASDEEEQIPTEQTPTEPDGDSEEGSPVEAKSDPNAEEDELAQYSDSVQRRIRKLTAKYREEERQREEAVRYAQQVIEQNRQLQEALQQREQSYVGEFGSRLEREMEAAKAAYRAAHEDGDADGLFDAQQRISKLAMEQARYEQAKLQVERQQNDPQAQQQPEMIQPTQQQARPDPKAQSWAERNTWFGEDQTMTYAAFGIHRQLIEDEGFDPTSDEYYNELDKRLRSDFPHKFGQAEAKKAAKPRVASAESTASRSSNKGRRTVKLTPSQVAIAKKLGVPLEEYAKYVKE